MEVAKRHQEQLARIKKTVKQAHESFKHNYDRFNEFRRFVFESSLKDDEINLLMTLGKPQLEFNILEAYISRLLGEFSKQEPEIEISADDQNTADPIVIKVLEQHIRHTMCDSDNHHFKYEVYKDILSGGFSTLKVKTEYANPTSNNQVIKIERCYDPTLCGFDQLAQYSHKGDGRFCFELFPMSKEDFKSEHPDVNINILNFRRDFAGFNWSYINDQTEIVLVCDYYEKKKKKIKVVQTRDGKSMTEEKYKEMVNNWDGLSQPPGLIGKPRKSEIDIICRYRVIETEVIEYSETDFSHFPLIFVDGSSILIRTPKNGNIRQVCRPYVYHAKGAQRLKNFAGISLANNIENQIQHKFKVSKESLPKEEDFLEAYKDIQKASVIVYNELSEDNPDVRLTPPMEIQPINCPAEIVQAFTGADQLIQNVLGSYDASLGINNNQLSGIAIVEAATQSNAAAMPYLVGFLQGYQRAAEIYVDLLPKYYTTPRTLPIMDNEGKKSFIPINQEQGVNMFYDSNALNVQLKAGASFQVQKSRTIMMVKEMMGMSPLFAQFIAEKGLNFVLDNMEGKGVDQLKQMVDGWLKEMQEQKQMAMQQQQQQMQNNPAMLKVQNDKAKIQLESQKAQGSLMLDMAKLKQDQAKIMADLQKSHDSNTVQLVKAETERFVHRVDAAIRHKDMRHKHAIDIHDRIHGDRNE